MCTSPITIRRFYHSIGERTYTVPCGKCEECTKKKQAEFGALSLHQALQSDSLYFITFTYRNEACPVAVSECSLDGPRVIAFERGCSAWLDDKGVFTNKLHVSKAVKGSTLFRACSLQREDVKVAIKLFRTRWHKFYPDVPLELKYAVFGELGERRGRPHYHGLFFGLSPAQLKMFTDIWNERFGYTCVIPPNWNRKLSLDEIKAVSAYTSKYVSKGIYSRWVHLVPYIQAPRRQSSLNFGGFSDSDLSSLCDFTFAAIFCPPEPDCLALASWIASYLDGSLLKLQVKSSLFLKD